MGLPLIWLLHLYVPASFLVTDEMRSVLSCILWTRMAAEMTEGEAVRADTDTQEDKAVFFD